MRINDIETVKSKKPHLIVRLLALAFVCGFAFIDHNPIVRLEAIIGLSPSPIERFFGVKSLFSGITEGVYQFVRMNFIESLKANVFAPLEAVRELTKVVISSIARNLIMLKIHKF